MRFSFRVIVKVVLAHLICDVSAALKVPIRHPAPWLCVPDQSSANPDRGISGNGQEERDIFDDWPTGTHEGVVAAAEVSLRADPQWPLERRARWISEGVFTANVRPTQRRAAEQRQGYGRSLDFVQSDALKKVFGEMRRERARGGIRHDFTVPEG
jgi:hypothetical protein